MTFGDVLAAGGPLVAVGSPILAWRSSRISKRAFQASQDPTVIEWSCIPDETGFPTRLTNGSTAAAHNVKIRTVVDEKDLQEFPAIRTEPATGVADLGLGQVATRYLETVEGSALAYFSTLPGRRLAASIRFRIGVDCQAPAGSRRYQEFIALVAHAFEGGRVVSEIHESDGRIVLPSPDAKNGLVS